MEARDRHRIRQFNRAFGEITWLTPDCLDFVFFHEHVRAPMRHEYDLLASLRKPLDCSPFPRRGAVLGRVCYTTCYDEPHR